MAKGGAALTKIHRPSSRPPPHITKSAKVVIVVGSVSLGRIMHLCEIIRQFPGIFVPIRLYRTQSDHRPEDLTWFKPTTRKDITRFRTDEIITFFHEENDHYLLHRADLEHALLRLEPNQRVLVGLTGQGYAQVKGCPHAQGIETVAYALRVADEAKFIEHLVQQDRMTAEQAGDVLEQAKRDSSIPPPLAHDPGILYSSVMHAHDVSRVSVLVGTFI